MSIGLKADIRAAEERPDAIVVIANADGLISCVEYLMNHVRPLINKLFEGLRGRTFPRQVTAPNGSARWQAASGRSFETIEEACNS